MTPEIAILPALSDNYIYVIYWDGNAIVVDPAEAAPVLDFLKKKNLKLKAILNTHHHFDHTGGNNELQQATGAELIAPDDPRIEGIDRIAREGEPCEVEGWNFEVFHVPGHTSSHIAFWLPEANALFCGDCLFNAGCGRLFEGSPQEMMRSLAKLSALPDDAHLFSGHEYTLKNLEFAQTVDPDNPEVLRRYEEAKKVLAQGGYTVPSTLALEKQTNPFLRVEDPKLMRAVDMEGCTPLQVFADIRARRNAF